ncbi:flagellar export chaperone FliS [Pseudomonas luteola]|uniref:flagellar export chaperone FliS n=1 Tax=Pseudomonas luteola TaxID=47886 RepID=UPI003A841522
MNSSLAMRQYQQVNTQAQVLEASPHRLIQMLMDGGLQRIAQAKGAIERERYGEKGLYLGKAIEIIGGLQEALDFKQGGEIAQNLNEIYSYMIRCLTKANKENDILTLDEVAQLLRTIKEGWDGIASV